MVADAAGGSDVALVLATFAWVAASGLLRAAGPTGAILGFGTSAMLVVYAGLPISYAARSRGCSGTRRAPSLER